MPKKIVICPSFASSHFLKCWIPNVIDVLEPDIIIINEGLFPNGPENRGHIDTDEFRAKWLYENTTAGFDFNISQDAVLKNRGDSPLITIGIINYDHGNADRCFADAISTFPGNEYWSTVPEIGDIIFPLEPDAFHHECDREKIDAAVSALKPGEGLKTKWVDFLETQYYTEAINIKQPKYRRFAYCFDNMPNYLAAMSGFTSQQYSKLKQCDEFITYHYPWFVYDKWKQLRYELIYRSDPQYWKQFDIGLNHIRLACSLWVGSTNTEFYDSLRPDSKIQIRPSRHDESRWAQFIDIDHPKEIQSHPNFVK